MVPRAGRVKNRMFAEAEKQNEEIKRLKRERARTWAEWNAQAEMAQTGLFEKVARKSHLKKTR